VTLGVGALCSTTDKPHLPHPNAIVLLSHVSGSTCTDSRGELHTIYSYPEEKLFGVCVGRIEMAADLFPAIQREFKQLKAKNFETYTEALNNVVCSHRVHHFRFDVLPNFTVVHGDIPQDHPRKVTEAWQQYDVGVHLIVGAFGDNGHVHLFVVARIERLNGWVHPAIFPGFAAIGLGAHSADFWLHYRRQVWSHGLKQSAYHAYEAAHLIERTQNVAGRMEMMIATNNKCFHLTVENPRPAGCPVSLLDLEAMTRKCGPRDTNADPAKPESSTPISSGRKRRRSQ